MQPISNKAELITVLKRSILVILAAFLLLLFGRAYPRVSGILLIGLLAYWCIQGSIYSWKRVRWLSPREWAYFRCALRRSFGASPLALALYAAFLAIGALMTCLLFIFRSPSWPVDVLILFSGILLCSATIVVWTIRLNYLLKKTAFRTLAKWVLGFMATTAVLFATVLAKKFTHMISLADPSSTPEFVRILTAFIFPFALAAVVSAFLTLVMFSQSVILLIGFTLWGILRQLSNHAGISIFKKDDFLYRLISGKRRPIRGPFWFRVVEGIQFLLRPIGTGAIAVLVASTMVVWEPLIQHIPLRYLQTMLVNAEYRNPHLCENVQADYFVAYLNDGFVSVAKPNGPQYIFSVSKCHKD